MISPLPGRQSRVAIATGIFDDSKPTMKLTTAVATVLIVSAIAGQAELPPQVYKDYQARSPEALTIKVTSAIVTTTAVPDGTRSDIAAQATVEAIARSATHLHVGDTIPVRYSRYTYKHPMPGPGQPQIVVQGQTYLAFLAKSDKEGTYELAAGGRSFTLSRPR
jgi:hypothetical protein